jgi:methionyl-tRNA synthetase
MATLVTRSGDPQALKVAMAAQATGQTLTIISSSEAKKLSADVLPPFGGSDLALILADGSVVGEANAMARHLGSSLSSASDLSVASWLEWEAAVLRPAVYAGDDATLSSALERIPSDINFLRGSAIDLADCVVAPTLHAAVLLDRRLNPAATAYLNYISSQDVFKNAFNLINAVTTSNKSSTTTAAVAADAAAFTASRPKLPVVGQRNILITSALPYVNNVPHLGNIIGCVLSADVYARFCRSRMYNCIYICGTDEYGTATETKALEENLSCQEICDKYHAIHKGIYEWFDISFDKFGRTPTRAQTAIGHEMFLELQNNNRLVEQTMEQLYSEPLQKFLADRYVVGTCPKCRYEDARGDQCDACGSLLNPTELINPKCKLSGTTPVVKQTKHIFLDLPALSEDLQRYITAASAFGGWSANCVQVTKAWMDQGLKIRCITRDLKWGTPVPMAGYEDKVFYVWFDAPIGYVSITAGYCGEDWRAWWLPAEYYSNIQINSNNDGKSVEVPDVELVQFMGKDNVPFHTVIFPASQLGTGRKWTMMKNISVTEYLNYEDGKFSKSRGVGVFGNDAKDTGIEVEVWRYYLLAIRPEVADSAFQWDDFASKNNADLNDNLGNFINRTLKFVHARFEGTLPGAASGVAVEVISALGEKVSGLVSQYIEAMEAQKMKVALQAAMNISRAGNGFFQETEIWKAVKEDRTAAAAYISACVGIVAVAASLLQPFMPSFTAKCLKQLGMVDPLPMTDDLVEKVKDIANVLPAGHKLDTKEPTPLFRKITEAEVAVFREKFAGSQADRAAAEASGSSNISNGEKNDAASANEKKAKKGENKAANGAPVAIGAAVPKKEKKAPGAAAKDLPVDISRIDLRVGHIRKAWRHPDAESLYVEEVDVGEAEGPRTVVSGLVKYIPEAEMQDRKVVLVCNLKPANMRGIKSQAMVLAATSTDGETVELVEPAAGAAVGERVFVEGFNNSGNEPDQVLNPKKKVWEAVQPDLKTDEQRNACYKGVSLRTESGVCTVKSIVGGSIK